MAMNMIYDSDSVTHLNIGERKKNDVPNSPEPVLGVIHFCAAPSVTTLEHLHQGLKQKVTALHGF